MMKEIFSTVLEMSLSGSAVILAVLVFRVLMRRCPKKVTIFLWLPAALQLILPLSIPASVSLFNLLPDRSVQRTESLFTVTEYPSADFGMTTAGTPVQPVSPAIPAPLPAADPAQILANLAVILWIVGMAAMLVWAAVQYGRLASRVKTAVRMEGEKHVYQSENIPTPFILGLFPPKIYVPYHLDSVSAWQVFSHEYTHLRLGDHLIKPAAYLILTLHWFNPLCWLAFALLGRDVEMRCDEAVLAYADPKEYGTALVKLAAEKRYSVTGPLAFGETSVKERVKHILSWKKPALWITIAAVVLCAVVGVVCITDAAETPYAWTSVITAEDFTHRDVTLHGYGLYEAEFTDGQLDELAQCLRNVPESAMHMYWRTISSSKKLINYTIDAGSDYAAALVWDGDHVILSSVQRVSATLQRRDAWRLDDPALEAFFTELEAAILAGQGTLIEESVPVSVSVSGTDTVIAPKWYPEGTWDHEYDKLPVLIMSESGHLCIHVYWQPETLYVYEEYYNSISAETTHIRRTTYTAAGPHADGGYTIEVTRQNPHLEEKAICYITNGEEKYIFKVVFPAENTKEAVVTG